MELNQEPNTKKNYKVGFRKRIKALIIFLITAGVLLFLRLAATGRIDTSLLFDPCGFKIDYGWPCPTCYMTTSAITMLQGHVFQAFYIQPAGAFFISLIAGTAFLAFIIAVLGIYLPFLERFFAEVRLRYVILVFFIVIAAGWAVTLAREFTQAR